MDFTEVYLTKHHFRPSIETDPNPRLTICVVIPCFNESGLIESLQSIWNCTRPEMAVEVIIVINSPENCSANILERNKTTLQEASVWMNGHVDESLRYHIIYMPDLPEKFAGVGLARKIGMDEAVYRLKLADNKNGIITGFDADAVCDSNYLVEIESHFRNNRTSSGASIYFEHPISGSLFDEEIYRGVCLYELHLRYLNQALRFAKHPHAYHTVGSSFAVRMDAYVKQGGMNKRQAGEDFYFLQKIIALGNFSEINTTNIHPSPRESNRVPFGTGASMMQGKTEGVIKTYHIKAFEDVKFFIGFVDVFFERAIGDLPPILAQISPSLRIFLEMNDFEKELNAIISNCASLATFRNRFFWWFNAFRVIKYLNFSHQEYYEKSEITTEAILLAQKLGYHLSVQKPKELLEFYRELDRSGFISQ